MFTSVWRLKGLTGSESGHLEIAKGRLIYTPGNGRPGFDVALDAVSDINFPWYYFRGGFKMRIGADKFRFSFVEPHNDQADVAGGRAVGKRWKKALTGE